MHMTFACRPRVPRGRRPFRAGFSLVELLLVLLVMAVVVMTALPSVSSALRDSRLSAAAAEVVNALEFARMTALTSGRGTRVQIDERDEKIELKQQKIFAALFDGGDQLGADEVEVTGYDLMSYPLERGAEYRFYLGDEDRFSGVDITMSDFSGPDKEVFFDALGTPSKGGSVRLALGGGQVVVKLDELSGTVTVIE